MHYNPLIPLKHRYNCTHSHTHTQRHSDSHMRHLINKYALQTPATSSNWLVMSSVRPPITRSPRPWRPSSALQHPCSSSSSTHSHIAAHLHCLCMWMAFYLPRQRQPPAWQQQQPWQQQPLPPSPAIGELCCMCLIEKSYAARIIMFIAII